MKNHVSIDSTAGPVRSLAPGISMDDEANAIDNLTEEEGNADSSKSASSTIL